MFDEGIQVVVGEMRPELCIFMSGYSCLVWGGEQFMEGINCPVVLEMGEEDSIVASRHTDVEMWEGGANSAILLTGESIINY